MKQFKNKNNEVVSLVEENDLNKKGNFVYLEFKSLADIENVLVNYKDYTVFGYSSQKIKINDVTIPEWTKFYAPYVKGEDNIFFAIYPTVSNFLAILGHSKKWGWNIKQL